VTVESDAPERRASARWRHREDVAAVDADGRVALLTLRHLERAPLILEDSGAVIWRLIEQPSTLEFVIASVADYFGMPAEVVAPGVEQFLGELRASGLAIEVEA
jgi:hypothetical protein